MTELDTATPPGATMPAIEKSVAPNGIVGAPVRPSRWAFGMSLLALILALFAAWQARQTRLELGDTRAEVAKRLAQADQSVGEARALTRQNQEVTAAIQTKLGALEVKIEESQGQAAALEVLYQEFARNREDRVLAEVEQSVNIAAQQLQLSGNVEVALIALQGAEARLTQFNQGQLFRLRQAMAQDIETLKSLPRVDEAGVTHRLEVLGSQVADLPLAYAALPFERSVADQRAEAEDPNAPWWRRTIRFTQTLIHDVGREIGSLVRVERLDQPGPVLLTPEQSGMLRENVRMRLFTARLALLTHDSRAYQNDLTQAVAWVDHYFDLQNGPVAAFKEALVALSKEPVALEKTSLQGTLTALRVAQAHALESDASRATSVPRNR